MPTADQIAQLRVRRLVSEAAGRRVRPQANIAPQREPRAIRMRYLVALRGIVADIQRATKAAVVDKLPELFALLPAELRLDAPPDDGARGLMLELRSDVDGILSDKPLMTLSERIARDVSTFNRSEFSKQMKIAIGIDPFVADANLSSYVDGFVAENVALIKSIGSEQLGRVEGIVMRALRNGTRVETVRKEIQQSFGLSRKRAELIATDQVSKLNGQLTRSRQQQVGIEKYRWSTSRDERVRRRHRELEGTVHSWSRPPVVDAKTGRREHPGGDFRCRCEAIPVVDDLLEQLGIVPPSRPSRPAPKPVKRPAKTAPAAPVPSAASPKAPPATTPSPAPLSVQAAAKLQQARVIEAAKQAQAAADAAALEKARAAVVVQAEAKQAALDKVATAQAKAAAYKAELDAQKKVKAAAEKQAAVEAAAASHKTAFEALATHGADPEVALKALLGIAQKEPEAFAQLYNLIIKGGKGLSPKYLKNLPKSKGKDAKKILTKLGFELAPPKPKWDKPYPPIEPAPLQQFSFQVVDGSGFQWHDVYSADGQTKFAFIKRIGDEWVVDPPADLKAKGWDKLTWQGTDEGKSFAVSYAIDVSEAIKASKLAPAKSAGAAAFTPAPKAIGWSGKWKGRRDVKVGADPAKDLAKRFRDGRSGTAVAGDGEWIEDFNIQIQQEIVDGRPEFVARFKVNEHKGASFRKAMETAGGRPAAFQFSGLDSLGSERLVKDLSKLQDAPGSHQGLRAVDVEGALVEFQRGVARGSQVSAMHNAVEVRLPMPDDLQEGYRHFARVMQKLGVDVTKGPNKRAIDTWKKAKLMSVTEGAREDLAALRSRGPLKVNELWERHATPELRELLEDVQLREVSPGKVAPYSPKLAQQLKDSGATHLVHHSSADAVELLEQVLVKDGQNALLSSRERYNRGLFFRGMSTSTDFETGGADSVFTRMRRGAPEASAGVQFEIDPGELGRLDAYMFNSDEFGRTGPDHVRRRETLRGMIDLAGGSSRSLSSSNEIMFRHSIPVSSVRRIQVPSGARARVLQMLDDAGVEQVNGIPVSDFIQSGSY